MMHKVKKIAVALSGGVDSAVSCFILKRKGYDVFGVHMQNWNSYDEQGVCSGEDDYQAACKAAKMIDIPIKLLNYEKEYWNLVFSETIQSYEKGLTPNPDILCNKHIKFGALFHHAVNELGADWLATGHYANLSYSRNGIRLLKARDSSKDQTYFLSHVHPDALKKTLFPVGDLKKSFVKEIALKYGLEEFARKPESYGMCFIGKREFKDFIAEYIPESPGYMVDIDSGELVTEHKGVHLWTIGQRVGLGGQPQAYYVCHIDPQSNTIYLGGGRSHPALLCNNFTCIHPHWISSYYSDVLSKSGQLSCSCRIRHQGKIIDCILELDSDKMSVTLCEPLRGLVAPGQYAVFYVDDECIGGAKISSVHNDLLDKLIHDRKLSRIMSATSTIKH